MMLLSKDFQGSVRVAERRSRDSLIRNGWSQSSQTSEILISSSRFQTAKNRARHPTSVGTSCDCLCTWPFGVPGSWNQDFSTTFSTGGMSVCLIKISIYQRSCVSASSHCGVCHLNKSKMPPVVRTWTFAPFSIRRRTTSKWPFSAAK